MPIVPEMREAVERIRIQCGKINSAVSFQSLYYRQDMQQILAEWNRMRRIPIRRLHSA